MDNRQVFFKTVLHVCDGGLVPVPAQRCASFRTCQRLFLHLTNRRIYGFFVVSQSQRLHKVMPISRQRQAHSQVLISFSKNLCLFLVTVSVIGFVTWNHWHQKEKQETQNTGVPRWLCGLHVRLLVSAQVLIAGS